MAFVNKQFISIYNFDHGHDEQHAKNKLQAVITHLQKSVSVVTCKITVELKYEDEYDGPAPPGPGGPVHYGIADSSGPVKEITAPATRMAKMRALVEAW